MEADASGRTDVTAVQGGADTTAPGKENQVTITSKGSIQLHVNHLMKGILV